ncbi:MAG: ATP-dependent DNA ligase [Candidatus Sungiibacteriota bacterium]|uniref:Probable DNA ligase n=1 Tax=Candidatus Sungiibacteriota bacterium TaxID=2750080 RepID=A0A7T5RKC0_9BACT|nr:MAG: ATP-dependent DNA ligase [Candidatus Sungbacteria bacterium]
MRFSELAKYLEKLEKTASRNEMTKILAEVLKEAEEEEIDKVCYLLLGELLPAYRGIEFNIAEKIMIQVLAAALEESPKKITKLYKSKGDLGDVAYDLLSQKRKPAKHLTADKVYSQLLKVSQETGTGSQERKIKKMAELLSELDARSAKFVVRIPIGKMRLGFSDATLLDALSFMLKGDKSARKEIEQAYNVTADIGAIAKIVKKSGLGSLQRIEPHPGIPIRPSLAERLRTVEEVIEKAGPEVGVEQKLDGFRTQIHLWREEGEKKIALFSRNLENTTAMFPEIVAAAKKLPVQEAILDGETIGYNPKSNKFSPFQETVQRKRKYDIEEFAKKIPLSIFVFDILYLNGKSLLERPFRERRKIIERVLPEKTKGALRLTPHRVTKDPNVILKELKSSIAAGLEGVVAKNLDAAYEAGSRGFHWIKLKATMAALEKLRGGKKTETKILDTIDCVVMGAYKGRGKRAVFGVGGLLLGIRGQDGRYYSISRLGTGLSDEQFREAHRRLGKLKVNTAPKEYIVDKEITPDIWVRPSLVVEILADEITLSPRHTAGRKGTSRGYSLRFPRLVRFRDDKNPEDATTAEEIKKLFAEQKK